MRPLLSHLPRLRKPGRGPWAGRESSFLSACPLRLIGVPQPVLAPPSPGPNDLPFAQRSVAFGDPSLGTEAGSVAKGRDHPAPRGRRVRRNLAKSAGAWPPPRLDLVPPARSRLPLPFPARATSGRRESVSPLGSHIHAPYSLSPPRRF